MFIETTEFDPYEPDGIGTAITVNTDHITSYRGVELWLKKWNKETHSTVPISKVPVTILDMDTVDSDGDVHQIVFCPPISGPLNHLLNVFAANNYP